MNFGIPEHKQLILFDGVCNLCDGAVQFIIKHDKKQQFLFTTLQGETAKAITSFYNIDASKLDSIILYTPKKGISYKSTAALKIALKLKFPIPLLGIFLSVPAFLRHSVYNFIAKNRYKWYGKKNACMIPTPELKHRFLD